MSTNLAKCFSLYRVCSTCKEEIKASICPCKVVANILIQLLLFPLSCLWYLSSLARPQLLFWMLLNRKIICHLSCRKGPVVLSLRPEQVLLASWVKRPCFYYKISIFPKEMQSVEITQFVWDKLWPDCILEKNPIISGCSQELPREIYGNSKDES